MNIVPFLKKKIKIIAKSILFEVRAEWFTRLSITIVPWGGSSELKVIETSKF